MPTLRVGSLELDLETRCPSQPTVEVWLARLTDSGRPVLVKRLGAGSGVAELAGLRREARLLARLRSPYFAGLLVFQEEQQILVTTRLPGMTLAERLQRGTLELAQGLRLADDLLNALLALHQEGVLHGDLKPEHVLLGPRIAALCDLGLAHSLCSEGPLGVTPAYASPEALGLLQLSPAPSSDLFSLGLLLHTAFTGLTPEVNLERRLDPPVRDAGLPIALQLFLERLCRPDPADRYQSAIAALDDLRRLRLQWDEVGRLSPFVLGTSDRRSSLAEPCRGGRESELDWLENQVRRAGATVVTGPGGRGKRTLLRLLADRLEPQGWRTVWLAASSSGEYRVDSPEHQVLDWMGQTLNEGEKELLESELAPWQWAALRAAIPGWDSALKDERPGRNQTLAALAAALVCLHKHRPLLLMMDQACFSSPGSQPLWRLLRGLVPLLVSGTEVSLPDGFELLELPTLDPTSARALLCSMAGPLPDEVLNSILKQAGGEPFLLISLLRGGVESGKLRPCEGGWQWSGESLFQTDRTVGWELSDRLAYLSPSARALLSQGAILGQSFSLSLASRLCTAGPQEIQELTSRHMIWVMGDEARFYHELIRQAVLGRWEQEALRKAHQAVAEEMKSLLPTPYAEIAFHLGAAGRLDLAFEPALKAAAEAESLHQIRLARRLLSLAREGLSESVSREVRSQLLGRLARATLAEGDARPAIGLFDEALSLSKASVERVALLEGKVKAMSRAFELAGLRHTAIDGLRELGRGVPNGGPSLWAAALGNLLALPTELERSRSRTLDQAELLEGQMLVSLAEGAVREERAAEFLWAVGKACRIFLTRCAPPEAAIAWSYGALIFQRLGWQSVSAALLARARQQAERHPSVLGQATGMAGFWWIGEADLPRALDKLEKAIAFCRAYDDGWNLDVCRVHRALVLYWTGRLSEAFQEAGEFVSSSAAQDSGLRLLAGWLLAQSPEWETVSSGFEQETRSVKGTFLEMLPLQLEGLLAMRRQAWGDAVRQFSQAVARYRPEAVYYGAGAGAWLCQAWRMVLERLPHTGQHLRRDILQEMGRALKKGSSQSRGWKVCQPHLWREKACWYAMKGRFDLARPLFERSLVLARRLKMPVEVALTLYERGRLAGAAGWVDWLNDEEEGLGLALALNAWIPGAPSRAAAWPSQVARQDRFEKVLIAGRRLATLHQSDEVLETLCIEAQTLLRCRQVRYVRVDNLADCWSETLARQALSRRCAVTEAELEEPSRSMLLGQARSILVAPVIVQGEAVGLLAARQKLIGGFFGREESQLADYLTTLAGAGLENAQAYEARASLYEALRVSEQRFRGFFLHAGIGTALLDEDGQVCEENPYLAGFLGGTCKGRLLQELSYELDRESLEACLARLKHGVEQIEIESRLRRHSGEIVWAQLTAARLPNHVSGGSIVVTVADMTHRRLTEMLTFLENERRSLAGDIHDEIAQNAAALNLELHKGQEPKLESARILSRRLTQETSRLIASLRGHPEQREPLLVSIRALLAAFSAETEIETELELGFPESELSLNGLHAIVLYRFVQEGLANIRKHAQAGNVWLGLHRHADQLKVRLVDDGRGFEPQTWLERQAVTQHFGMQALMDRARFSGAEFFVRSTPGQGSELELVLPFS